MKHIKIFENFIDEYFTLIDVNDLEDISNRIVGFDKDESTKIKELFTKKYIVGEKNLKTRFISMPDNVFFIEGTRPSFSRIKIWKMEDEWYLVSISDFNEMGSVFHKCDQFEGLKKFLNKTLVK